MSEPISIPISFPGAAESQSAVAALTRAVEGLSTNTDGLSQSQQGAAASTQNLAQGAIQFTQRLASAANAVQSLTSRMGGTGGTAGLVGSVAATTAQFAAMGSALGPGGALFGAVAGLALGFHELTSSMDETTQASAAATQSIDDMVQSYTHLQESMALQERLRDGTASLAEEQDAATAAQARYSAQITHAVELQNQLAELEREDGTALAALVGGPFAAREASRRLDIERIRGQIAASQELSAQLLDEAHRTTELADAQQTLADRAASALDRNSHANASAGRGGGGSHGGPSPEDQEQERLFAMLQQTQSQYEQMQAIRDAYTETSVEGTKAEEEAERSYQATLRATQRQQEEADRQRHKSIEQHLREEEQTKQKLQRESQERTQQGQEATGALIGNLTNVFSVMAQGQANAAQAGELLLAGFLQYISQRATIEALAQVAQAIGSYPDFGGMALHFAAAAAWGAVAVATGVGGAALQSDAQGQAAQAQSQAQQKPAEPQSSSDDKEKGGNTYVINWNAPVITAQTEAQLGRGVRRVVDRATQRFPNG